MSPGEPCRIRSSQEEIQTAVDEAQRLRRIFLVATLVLLDRVLNTLGVAHQRSFKLAVGMEVRIGSGPTR